MQKNVASDQFARRDLETTGQSDATILADLLRQAFAALDGPMLDPDIQFTGPVIGFRAVAPDLAHLVAEMVRAAADESDAQHVRVLAVDIAGVMPTDEGIRGWGYLAIADRTDERPAFTIAETPIIETHNEALRATVTLMIDGVHR